MNIKLRVLLITGVLGIVPLISFLVWEFKLSIDRLEQRSFEQLKTVREIKRREIEWYFAKLREESIFFAQSNVLMNAMKDLNQSYQDLNKLEIPTGYREKLRSYYVEFKLDLGKYGDNLIVDSLIPQQNPSIILQNQYLLGTKAVFDNVPYVTVHNRYHNTISSFINTYELYDLFLIDDKSGTIIYSVSKEIDFGTSLLSGPFANSNLGILYRKIRFTGLKNETFMCDYERYLPSKLAPAAFIAAPIFDGETKIGTLILQVPLKKIEEIATSKREWKEEGLGETGETYIVGNDFRMRTDSRFMIENSAKYLENISINKLATPEEIELMKYYQTAILFQKVNSESVSKAIARTSGTMAVYDYRNIKVLSSYAPLAIKDVSWSILAEIDESEIYSSVVRDAKQSIIVLFVVVSILFLASLVLARTIYRPINILASGMKELGKGNFNVHFKIKSNDEFGLLADTFNKTILSLKTQREEILAKNKLLDEQKVQLQTQAEGLILLNNEISTMNANLDVLVKERTEKVEIQNKKLFEYAFFNSHRLRAPVSNILGLTNLLKSSLEEKERKVMVEMLEKATNDLDAVVHEIQELLEKSEYKV